MELGLKGKRALVLASSQGLGFGVAEALAAEGASVCLHSRSAEKLKALVPKINAAGFVAEDLSKPGSGTRVVEQAREILGGIDILVTNTGGPAKGEFAEITSEQWLEDYQSVWMSVVESVQACLPAMRESSWGRVVMITSISAKQPLAGLTTSNGLRCGLGGLAKSLSKECAADGITVNCVLPGFTDTERLRSLKLSDEKVRAMIPAGRLGKTSEFADCVSFLVSERAAYITGQQIAVDGGFLSAY